jgi:hypothetical protein
MKGTEALFLLLREGERRRENGFQNTSLPKK